MKILTKEQILLLHSQLIEGFGGSSDIRDNALLDSAINTPFQTYDSEELYPTLLDKASRLCFGLVKNHPFVDGNKRIGTHAMLVFLAINGVELEYSDTELINLILSVAAGTQSRFGYSPMASAAYHLRTSYKVFFFLHTHPLLLTQEIVILILIRFKIILGSCTSAERLTFGNLLNIAKSAGNTAISVSIKRIKGY